MHKELREKIKKIRKEVFQKTQGEIAQILGINQAVISNIEKQDTIHENDILYLIYILECKISPKYLFFEDDIFQYTEESSEECCYLNEFNNDFTYISERLKTIRKEYNLRQKDIANSIKVSRSIIIDIENKKNLIRSSTYKYIMFLYNEKKINPSYILRNDNKGIQKFLINEYGINF